MRLSVIVPALNEGETIAATLARLQPLRARGHEVLVVDGGSRDDTRERAAALADRVLQAPRGRARQMNAGAAQAGGDLLWFLHADTLAPVDADRLLAAVVAGRRAAWGRFDVRLSGRHPLLWLVGRLMNLRSRLTGIATGDQGLFVSRGLFGRVGGFPDLPLMEDVELSRRLRRELRPLCLRQRLVTSSRRWEQRGVLRTVLLMWYLRAAWALGVPARRLAARYE
ncbi:MAG TPA: glycosyltransferase [Gammaproteobacteria bacterium]|nr:glycosyltransferase [Gammaproteobacteria bacterium]